MAPYITPTMLIPVLVLALILTLFSYFWSLTARPRNAMEAARLPARRPMAFAGRRHPMEKKDALPILLITVIYALTAFFRLGSDLAPQTAADLSQGQVLEYAFDQPVRLQRLMCFSGLGTGSYNVEISADGSAWSTLWQHHKDDGSLDYYYWASAEGYSPSYAMPQKYTDLFKWREITFSNPQDVLYFRITGKADKSGPLELAELVLYDADGRQAVPTHMVAAGPDREMRAEDHMALFDEPGTVPATPSWFDSAYFDEIYHPRTALEHIRGVYPYEVSHPPLGKLIIGLGIRVFGMTPFGWRSMGALFGVLMLPILYIFLKNLFGKTVVAACGTVLFAADFMHLVQTRIATIDTYGVFFILCMYFFLYRWLTLPAGSPFHKGIPSLFLCGLMWGLGISSKWTVIYGGVGLAVLYFIGFGFQIRDWPLSATGRRIGRAGWIIKTLLFSVLCFIVLPGAIYTASYIPYALAAGVALSPASIPEGFRTALPVFLHDLAGHLTQGKAFSAQPIPTDSLPGIMLQNQWFMLTYHQGVTQAHPYSSRWYQWVVDARPILYYLDYAGAGGVTNGLKAAFGCFNNPAVAWGGFFAVCTAAARIFRHRWSGSLAFLVFGCTAAVLSVRADRGPGGLFAPELGAEVLMGRYLLLGACLALFLLLGLYLSWVSTPETDSRALFLVVGWLSQLVPWMLIGRTTFEYHYFPATIFLVLGLCWVFNELMDRRPQSWKAGVYGLTAGAAALYVLFYPVLVGLMVPVWYTRGFLRWLPSWPF